MPHSNLTTYKYRDDQQYNSKARWTIQEDHRLLEIVQAHGPKHWKDIANIFGGGRTGKIQYLVVTWHPRTKIILAMNSVIDLLYFVDIQCLHRYNQVLNPEIKKGPWTEQEDAILRKEVKLDGSTKISWNLVAEKLSGKQ